MSVKVNFFGVLSEVTGEPFILLNDCAHLQGLMHKLYAIYPALNGYKFITCIDTRISEGDEALEAGATINLLPPFSGG